MQTNFHSDAGDEFNDNSSIHNTQEATMSCDEVWDLLSVYADGEATPEETAMVENHIAVCADCARDLKFMQSTALVLQDTPEVEPPADLREAIFAATINRPTLQERFAAAVRRTLSPVPVRYGAVAAAGAAAALAAFIFTHQPEPLTNPVEYRPIQPPVVADRPAVTPTAPATPSLTLPTAPSRTAQTTTEHAANVAPVRLTSASRRSRHHTKLAAKMNPTAQQKTAATTRIARNTPAFKAKVTSTPTEVTFSPIDTVPVTSDIMPESPMTITEAHVTNPEPVGTAPKTPAPTGGTSRIIVAGSNSINTGQIASLADLRRSLRSQSSQISYDPSARTAGKDREIRLDFIKSRF
jgi:anti-sigma factor RsiW